VDLGLNFRKSENEDKRLCKEDIWQNFLDRSGFRKSNSSQVDTQL
jgi:hypothetical protein